MSHTLNKVAIPHKEWNYISGFLKRRRMTMIVRESDIKDLWYNTTNLFILFALLTSSNSILFNFILVKNINFFTNIHCLL